MSSLRFGEGLWPSKQPILILKHSSLTLRLKTMDMVLKVWFLWSRNIEISARSANESVVLICFEKLSNDQLLEMTGPCAANKPAVRGRSSCRHHRGVSRLPKTLNNQTIFELVLASSFIKFNLHTV